MADMAGYARWLRTQRERVSPRLSQKELGRQAGLTGAYISRLEMMDQADPAAPINNPSPDAIDKIARALENHTRRPLVNESRQAIGYPLLAEASLPEPEMMGNRMTGEMALNVFDIAERLLMPENRDLLEMTTRALAWGSSRKRTLRRAVDVIDQTVSDRLTLAA